MKSLAGRVDFEVSKLKSYGKTTLLKKKEMFCRSQICVVAGTLVSFSTQPRSF